MSLQRPLVSIYNSEKVKDVKKQVALPDVFMAPVRPDIIKTVLFKQLKNKRQPYAVNKYAGLQTAAESWGTGRAVSRIPRVPGGGTHRAGQGAFGNMCRGGRLFAPTKVWRRWAHKISKADRRYARVSAIAATGEPAFLEARGHKIHTVNEIPLVVTDDVESYETTKKAVAFLRRVGAFDDYNKCVKTKKRRTGKGKLRNRKYVVRRGPLIIFKTDKGLSKAFRNLPGVDTMSIQKLDLHQLAPGGQVGRFIIWTESAFNDLNSLFGSYDKKGAKSILHTRNFQTYTLPKPCLENSDIDRIIQSDAVQSVVRDRIRKKTGKVRKINPYKNKKIMEKLNPYYSIQSAEWKKKMEQKKK